MRILVFGEIIYDVYGDEYAIGGAPFNFSVQLNRMMAGDGSVSIISAVGRDELGSKALEFANKENLDSSLIQILDSRPTGKAMVFLDNNKTPDYDIVLDAAWDNIAFNDSIERALSLEYDVFYFNLLSQRQDPSASTLRRIMRDVKARFKTFDMTLRKDFFSKEKIKAALEFVNVLKINEEEFSLIRNLFYPNLNQEDALLALYKDFDIAHIFLTLGGAGARLLCKNGFFTQKVGDNVEVIDTVGAGDSFCAALSYALMRNLGDKETLEFSVKIAELLTQVRGGTSYCDFSKIKSSYFKD